MPLRAGQFPDLVSRLLKVDLGLVASRCHDDLPGHVAKRLWREFQEIFERRERIPPARRESVLVRAVDLLEVGVMEDQVEQRYRQVNVVRPEPAVLDFRVLHPVPHKVRDIVGELDVFRDAVLVGDESDGELVLDNRVEYVAEVGGDVVVLDGLGYDEIREVAELEVGDGLPQPRQDSPLRLRGRLELERHDEVVRRVAERRVGRGEVRVASGPAEVLSVRAAASPVSVLEFREDGIGRLLGEDVVVEKRQSPPNIDFLARAVASPSSQPQFSTVRSRSPKSCATMHGNALPT